MLVRDLETSALTGHDYLLSPFGARNTFNCIISGLLELEQHRATQSQGKHESLWGGQGTNGSPVPAMCTTGGTACAASYAVGHLLD